MTPTNNALPELRECPFCGTTTKLFLRECEHAVVGSYWIAGCNNFECDADSCCVDKPTREEAIAAWNRRASAGREAVAWGVMYPSDHPQAGQIWTTFVDRASAVEGKDSCWNAGDDLIVPLYTRPTAPELPKQGEGGREDAARLDWLMGGVDRTIFQTIGGEWCAQDDVIGAWYGATPREAIDNAIRALAKKAEGA